jgi:hypothetical protein
MGPGTYSPGYKDKDGYWHSARSDCCGAWLVYYNEELEAFVHWAGWGAVPPELRCRSCNRVVIAEAEEPCDCPSCRALRKARKESS